MTHDIERKLAIPSLRAGFLKYTRHAYRLLPTQNRPRMLEIGCGSGTVTIELARLSNGTIASIDVDKVALEELRSTITRENLGHRVTAKHSSLMDTGIPDQSFDLLWEEGVLHLLDLERSLTECSRLLRPNGFLVSCETVDWFAANEKLFLEAGFEIADHILWPKRSWWNDYYAPLERNVSRLRTECLPSPMSAALRGYDDEIETAKQNPEKLDCGHFLLKKTG